METCRFCVSIDEELPDWKLPPLGSSKTTEALFVLPLASLGGNRELSAVLLPRELMLWLDSVLCRLLFWMAYFLRLEAEGDSLLDFLRVEVLVESSREEAAGQAVVLSPSSPQEEAPLGRVEEPLAWPR